MYASQARTEFFSFFCLFGQENFMDCIVHGVAKSWTQLSSFHFKVKLLHSICQANLENSAVDTGLEKGSFHSNPKERKCQRMFRLPQNLISYTSKVMLKILQARLQQYMSRELPDVQAGFRNQKNQRSNCQHPFNH